MKAAGKGDNAIISIADIAISACALPRRGEDPLCRVSW